MKNLFLKTGGIFIVILIFVGLALQPVKAQDYDFEGWQWYDAYTRMNPRIHFEAWIFTTESIREIFGLSYIIGYMDGVNHDDSYSYSYRGELKSKKWYLKGNFDGYLDSFLIRNRQCLSLRLISSYSFGSSGYFGFFDYINPFRAVRNWLQAISYPNFFAPFACLPSRSVIYASVDDPMSEFIYLDNPTEKPTRPSDDYRNNEEHKNISPGRIAEVPEYDPTDKPTRSPNDYRNNEEHKGISPERIAEVPEYDPTDKTTRSSNNVRNRAEHTTVNLKQLTENIEVRPQLNNRTRNRGRSDRSVLQRVYNDWPALRRYVEKNGRDRVRVVHSVTFNESNYSMERAVIEIAIPGRQFSREFSRSVASRYNINLPEFNNRPIRRYGATNSRDYNRNRYRSRDNNVRTRETHTRTTTNTEVRTSTRDRNRSNHSRNRGTRENSERDGN